MKRKKLVYTLLVLIIITITLSITLVFKQCSGSDDSVDLQHYNLPSQKNNINDIINITTKKIYGIDTKDYNIDEGIIKNGETFSLLFNNKYDLNIVIINKLVSLSKGVFDLRDMKAGNNYTAFLKLTNDEPVLNYLVYDISPVEYVLFSTYDSIYLEMKTKPIVAKELETKKVIEKSIYQTFENNKHKEYIEHSENNTLPPPLLPSQNSINDKIGNIINVPTKKIYGINPQNYIISEGSIKNGETFSLLLNNKYDLNIVIINKLVELSKGIFDLRDMKAGNHYTAFSQSIDSTNTDMLHYLVYDISQSEYVIFSTFDSIYLKIEEKPVVVKEKYAEGVIKGSLYQTFVENDINPIIANKLAEIYKSTLDFFDIQEGDRFRVLYEERFIDSISTGLRRLYGAEIIHKGVPYKAIRFEQNNQLEYWDSKGNSLKKAFLRAPLSYNARVSSPYGMRIHPIRRIRLKHNGIDYAAPTGTPVLAVADGTIKNRYWDYKGGGNVVWIKHTKGLESAYLHLSRFAKGIYIGKRVKKGQIIAYVGSTGMSTGPHLDFRIKRYGRYINPDNLPTEPGDPIHKSNRKKFNQMYKEVMEVMEEYSKMNNNSVN